jgi:AcrR family transcriptional regulator
MSPRGPSSPRTAKRRPGAGRASASGRGSLSRAAILRAALHVADRDGFNGLTIRKVAAELGVSPMALYRHFRNKDEIVDGLVDAVVGEYDVTNHEEASACDWLRETFRLMHQALCEHPGIIPLLGGAALPGTNATEVMEHVLAVLRKSGLGEAEAALLFYTLMGYTIGAVGFKSGASDQTNGDSALDPEERLRQSRLSFEMAPRGTYPTIVALAPHLALYSTDRQFMAGLDRILFATLREAPEQAGSDR